MVTVKITDQDVRKFFKDRPAINIKAFCKQFGISYDGFNAFVRGKDKRYATLSYQKMQEVMPGLFLYGFKLPTAEVVAEPTEEEEFLAENQ